MQICVSQKISNDSRFDNRFQGISYAAATMILVLKALVAFILLGVSTTAMAATCNAAASQGAAPASWETYCWINFVDYEDPTAMSAAGQDFSFTLPDGSVLSFNLRTTSSASTGAETRTVPSFSGAAIGNSSFLGIPGRPILYMSNYGSTVTFDFTNISIAPPPGVPTVTEYEFVVADAESTDLDEFLEFNTNGASWELLDTVQPISGSAYPILSGVGSPSMRIDGGGNTGRVGAYIAGSRTPTQVMATMDGFGLQGMMFAVRFASITLNKQIVGGRVDASDQFEFGIESTSTGTIFASGTTVGTGNGPFPAAVFTTASGIPLTLSDDMESGSNSTLSQYSTRLTCTNSSVSTTPLPSNVQTNRFDFGQLNFGDTISCTFTSTPFPHVTFQKQMGVGGRIFDTDQFALRIEEGSEGGTLLANTQTTGAGSTISNGSTGPTQLISGNSYVLYETAAGSTDLSRYDASYDCSNANSSSSTILPSGTGAVHSIAAVLGDIITCTVTNTREPANALLRVEKRSRVISDGVNSSDPKAIPGAIIEYTITVRNEGDLPADSDSLIIVDILPAGIEYSVLADVSFTNGTTVSGLNIFDADTMVRFSSQPSGVGPYNYSPVGSYDANVTGIQISPEGTMSASNGTNHPEFSVTFQVRIL